MDKRTIKQNLYFLRGRVDTKTFNMIVSACQESITDYISSEGVEIWSADCRKRILAGSEKSLKVCRYDDPLHGIKEYDSLDAALKFLNKDVD